MVVRCEVEAKWAWDARATYKGDPVPQVRVVSVLADEVCGDTEDDQGGDGVQSMVCSEKRAVEFVRADSRGAVVVRRCCCCCIVTTSECHCCDLL